MIILDVFSVFSASWVRWWRRRLRDQPSELCSTPGKNGTMREQRPERIWTVTCELRRENTLVAAGVQVACAKASLRLR